MGLLDGKVAIVTGAGRGLGRTHALLLASEGARIVVNDLGGEWDGAGTDNRPAQQVVEEIKAAGGDAVANYESCSNWNAAEAMIQQAVDEFGDFNILVNNAGILRDKMNYNMDESDWDSVIDVHLKGHFALSHFASVYWRARSKAGDEIYARVINTSSESGLFGNAGQTNYAAAKAGIIALTVATAREMGKIGVTANAIAPRARTRMTEMTFGGFGEQKEGEFDMFAPENVSPVVGWLASPAAAEVSGQTFVVWGSEVQLVRPWTLGGKVDAGGKAFTVDSLTAAMPDLFKKQSPGVPAFGVLEDI
jgi:NAD(P)-dependent dehydrogenase (short-subunit alcohol dehydrogenase family)